MNFAHMYKNPAVSRKTGGVLVICPSEVKKTAKILRIFLFLFTRRISIIFLANEIEEIMVYMRYAAPRFPGRMEDRC